MEFPTLKPPRDVQHKNPSGKYLNPSTNKILYIYSGKFPDQNVKNIDAPRKTGTIAVPAKSQLENITWTKTVDALKAAKKWPGIECQHLDLVHYSTRKQNTIQYIGKGEEVTN